MEATVTEISIHKNCLRFDEVQFVAKSNFLSIHDKPVAR